MKAKNYYVLLGVPTDATPDRITRAYRRLAREWHPDAAGGSAEQFQTLQDAYQTLSNEIARERYDRSLRARTEPVPVRSSRGYDESRPPVHPSAASGEILLSRTEARRGGALPIEIPMQSTCKACRGRGVESWMCATCSGYGFVYSRVPVLLRLPAGVQDGTVFQIHLDAGTPVSVMLVVHVVR